MAKLRFPAASTPDFINGCPFEVLDHIFQDCLDLDAPSYDVPEWPIEHLFPYNASNVCTRWRQILTAHRRYWKYVFIDIAKDTAPFLDVIAQFHADYTTKGVVIFSSIRNQTPVQVPGYYTADFENARAGQIVKRLMPIVSVCTRVIFDLVYQSSLPSVADILRPYNIGLTQVCLTCIVHDCDEAVVGVPDLQYPVGDDDIDPDTDSTDSDEDDELYSSEGQENPASSDGGDLPAHSADESEDAPTTNDSNAGDPPAHISDEAEDVPTTNDAGPGQDNMASNAGNPPAHTPDETEDAPTTNDAGPHDHGNEPAPETMKPSNLAALTKLHITGVGFREMFALGVKWQWKAFPHGNDKLDLRIDHLRIGPYLYNSIESFRELNSLTQFTAYISCMPCRITFSDISLHYSVDVSDPEHFDAFMTQGMAGDDLSVIDFPALTFIMCDQDFIAGFLRYTWNGDTFLEVDSPLITFDSCLIPQTFGPRRMVQGVDLEVPRFLILKNIPVGTEDVDKEANNGSSGKQRENSSVVHAFKWFPYVNIVEMENCEGLSHSVLMTLTRKLITDLELRNCRGFTATTIRDIIERYQYYAMIMDDPTRQLTSMTVTGGPLMSTEDAMWFHSGGGGETQILYQPRD